MSRVHAQIRLEGGHWVIENQSKHGTLIGRKKIDGAATLRRGDVVTLGDTRVVFELESVGGPRTPGDTYTPATPTIAAPPSAAGYDEQGVFHMGQTLLGPGDAGAQTSFLWLGGSAQTQRGLKVKKRRVYLMLVLLIMGLAGCLATGALIVLPTFLKHPGILLKATAFAFLPAIPHMLLIKLLDRNRQIPWSNYIACLVWGGTVGCGFSLVLNTLSKGAMHQFLGLHAATGLTATLVAPAVEEVVKGLGVLVVFWILHDEFDNVLEGMVLGAASGLGFALVENVVYDVRFLERGNLDTLLVFGTYRTLVNALIGHPVYTALFGAGLGLLRETHGAKKRRFLYPVIGLAVAVGLHLVWNGAAVLLGSKLRAHGEFYALAVTTVVFGGAGLLFFVAAYLFAAGRERRVLVTYLGEEVEKGFVEPGELASFQQLLGRERFEYGGLATHGWAVFKARRSLRSAQVELAFRKWHLARGDAVRGDTVDAYVHQARTQIRDARNRMIVLEGPIPTAVGGTLDKNEPPTPEMLDQATPGPASEQAEVAGDPLDQATPAPQVIDLAENATPDPEDPDVAS
jgi:RsiW-degrading membrane proteinase PrsW (M82 family)